MDAAKHLVQSWTATARTRGVARLITADLVVAAGAATVIAAVTAADRAAHGELGALISLLPG